MGSGNHFNSSEMEFVEAVCQTMFENMKKEFANLSAVMEDPTLKEEMTNSSTEDPCPITSENLSFLIKRTKLSLEISHQMSNTNGVLLCCKSLETLGSNYRAYPIGSRAVGLCDEYSDLDIFLDVGDMFNGNNFQETYDQQFFVKEIAKLLRRSPDWFSIIEVKYARTPIIRAFHKPTDLHCDISFRNGLGSLNTDLLRTMMNNVPVLKPLILTVKYWCKTVKIHETFRSYCVIIMIIFYLQVRNMLPALEKMRSLYKGRPIVVSGWEVHLSQRPAVFSDLTPAPSLIHLLFGFFDYYGNVFKYRTDVVCPLLGHTILKSDFDSPSLLPDEMSKYKMRMEQRQQMENTNEDDPYMELFRSNSAVCVQDPFDLSHNLSKAVSDHGAKKFSKYCSIQAAKLKVLMDTMDRESYTDDFWKE